MPTYALLSPLAWLLSAAIGAIPDAASAQDAKPPRIIEEAFLGDLAFMQERGETQISSLLRTAGASANRTARVPLAIEYGITDDFQVGIKTGGFNYERPTGWSPPREFGLALRYGRYDLLPNLHASATIEAESVIEGGKRITNTTSGVQLGVDIPRLRMTHVFTSVTGGVWNSEGIKTGVDWAAGVVAAFGHLRGTLERPLRVTDPANRGTVPGLIWKVGNGFDIGVATTLRTQPAITVSGAMLSLLLEF
jgi:hypothetical protein